MARLRNSPSGLGGDVPWDVWTTDIKKGSFGAFQSFVLIVNLPAGRHVQNCYAYAGFNDLLFTR
jgi:hypothetical protein